MPFKGYITPTAMLDAIDEQASTQTSPWVPTKAIKLRAGAKHHAIQRAADYLYANQQIERRWIVTQWWYRRAAYR